MNSVQRVGFFSASGLFLAGLLYLLVVAVGIADAGFSRPITDPTLAIMEILTILCALLFLILMSAIYQFSSEQKKVFAVIALCFATLMTGLSCTVHFVALTAGRQTGFSALEWPSTYYAIELLAWDGFLGLSMLFAASIFTGTKLRTQIRWALCITGMLSFSGIIGPIIGDMTLQRIGIAGYGIGLPITALLLARLFSKDEHYLAPAKR